MNGINRKVRVSAPDFGEPELLQEPVSCDVSLIVLVIQLQTQKAKGCIYPRLEFECTFVMKRLMNMESKGLRF